MRDDDSRWVNRGGVDLLGANPDKEATSVIGLPQAELLYGKLPEQFSDKNSFASQLRQILAIRDKYKIALGELVSPPPYDPENSGVCLLAMRLPGQGKAQLAVTALNFGREPAEEEFDLVELFKVRADSIRGRQMQITNAISGDRVGVVSGPGRRMTLKLDAIQGMTLLVQQ